MTKVLSPAEIPIPYTETFLVRYLFECEYRNYHNYPFCVPIPVVRRYEDAKRHWELVQCRRMELDHE